MNLNYVLTIELISGLGPTTKQTERDTLTCVSYSDALALAKSIERATMLNSSETARRCVICVQFRRDTDGRVITVPMRQLRDYGERATDDMKANGVAPYNDAVCMDTE